MRRPAAPAIPQDPNGEVTHAAIELNENSALVGELQPLQHGDDVGARHVGVEYGRLRRRMVDVVDMVVPASRNDRPYVARRRGWGTKITRPGQPLWPAFSLVRTIVSRDTHAAFPTLPRPGCGEATSPEIPSLQAFFAMTGVQM